jgi:hypothetical protein
MLGISNLLITLVSFELVTGASGDAPGESTIAIRREGWLKGAENVVSVFSSPDRHKNVDSACLCWRLEILGIRGGKNVNGEKRDVIGAGGKGG